MDDTLETRLAHKRLFADFLTWEDADGWKLADQIRDDLSDRDRKTNNVQALAGSRVDVQNYRLRAWNTGVQRQLLERPTEYLPGLQDAVADYVRGSDELGPELGPDAEVRAEQQRLAGSSGSRRAACGAGRCSCCWHRCRPAHTTHICPHTPRRQVRVGIRGEFGDLELSPRDLGSSHLGKLVKVYGIVTRCSLVRPKLARSVHYCAATGVTSTREYRDVTALTGLPTGG